MKHKLRGRNSRINLSLQLLVNRRFGVEESQRRSKYDKQKNKRNGALRTCARESERERVSYFQCIIISESGVSQQKDERERADEQKERGFKRGRLSESAADGRRRGDKYESGQLQSSVEQHPESRGPFESEGWWNLLCFLAAGQCRGHAARQSLA